MQVGTGHLVKGTLQVSASRAVDGVVGLAFSVIVARTLGPDYGYVGAAMGVWGVLNIVSTVSVPIANTRYVADLTSRRGNEAARTSVGRTMLLECVLTAVAAVALFLLAGPLADDVFHKPGLAGPLRIVAPMLLFAGVSGVWLSTFQGLHRYGPFASIVAINPLVRLGGAVVFLALGWGVAGAMYGFLVGHAAALLLGTALGAVLLARDLPPSDPDQGTVVDSEVLCVPPRYGELLSFGAVVTVGTVASVVFESVDKLMLAAWRPIGEVAIYTVAFGMVAVPLVLPRSVNVAFYPLVSTLNGRGDMATLRRVIAQVMRLMLLIMGFVTFTMMALAPWLLGLLYGEDFAGAVAPFMVLALWGFVRPVGTLAFSIPQGMGRPMVGAWGMVLTMALSVGLNAALIPMFGIMGAAVATTFSYALGFSYITYSAFRLVGATFPWDAALRAMGSAAGAAAAAFALRYALASVTATSPAAVLLPALLVGGLLALGVYLLLLGLSRAVSEEEVAFVRGLGFFGSRTLARIVAFLCRMRPRRDAGRT